MYRNKLTLRCQQHAPSIAQQSIAVLVGINDRTRYHVLYICPTHLIPTCTFHNFFRTKFATKFALEYCTIFIKAGRYVEALSTQGPQVDNTCIALKITTGRRAEGTNRMWCCNFHKSMNKNSTRQSTAACPTLRNLVINQ